MRISKPIFASLLLYLSCITAYSQKTIQAYSDGTFEITVHQVPVNILGSSQSPIKVKNKGIDNIKEIVIQVDCDCSKGGTVTRKAVFNSLKAYSTAAGALTFVDCNGLVTNCSGSIISIKKESQNPSTDQNDSFWDGEMSSRNENSKQIGNDYWSGGKESSSASNSASNSDFWKGQGTFNEEKYLDEHTISKESNQFIGEIESRTKTVKIVCWDHGTEDGDRVSIKRNKGTIESNVYLTTSKKSFLVNLDFGMNRIDFEALNQGSLGPNTATFEVYDDSGRLISSKQWNILTGYSATLLVLKL